jgi:hypothetical protein
MYVTFIYILAYIHIHKHTHIHTYSNREVHIHIQTERIHTETTRDRRRDRTPQCGYVCMCLGMCMYVLYILLLNTLLHPHTYTSAHIETHTHTHTHTHTSKQRGTPIDVADGGQKTPLQISGEERQRDAAMWLVDHGAVTHKEHPLVLDTLAGNEEKAPNSFLQQAIVKVLKCVASDMYNICFHLFTSGHV